MCIPGGAGMLGGTGGGVYQGGSPAGGGADRVYRSCAVSRRPVPWADEDGTTAGI